MKRHRFSWVLIPLLGIISPWFYIFLWTLPFALFLSDIISVLESAAGIALPDLSILFRDEGLPFCYAVLIVGVIINFVNARALSGKRSYREMWHSLLLIRIASLFTYPVLVWGILLALLYMMGTDRNVYIFYLMLASFPALNLTGAFYAAPMVSQLKKIQKANNVEVNFFMLSQFMIGLDILTVLMMRRKIKALIIEAGADSI